MKYEKFTILRICYEIIVLNDTCSTEDPQLQSQDFIAHVRMSCFYNVF